MEELGDALVLEPFFMGNMTKHLPQSSISGDYNV